LRTGAPPCTVSTTPDLMLNVPEPKPLGRLGSGGALIQPPQHMPQQLQQQQALPPFYALPYFVERGSWARGGLNVPGGARPGPSGPVSVPAGPSSSPAGPSAGSAGPSGQAGPGPVSNGGAGPVLGPLTVQSGEMCELLASFFDPNSPIDPMNHLRELPPQNQGQVVYMLDNVVMQLQGGDGGPVDPYQMGFRAVQRAW